MLKAIVIFLALSILAVRSNLQICNTHCLIKPQNSIGLCLEIEDGYQTDGATLVIQACNTSRPQQYFDLNPSSPGHYAIVNENSKKCLEISDNNQNDGAAVQQSDCTGASQQIFTTTIGPAGTIVASNGKCLDVTDQSKNYGARIQQYGCSGGNNQQFQVSST